MNVCRSSPRRAVSGRTWAGPPPGYPARSVHRLGALNGDVARLTSLVLGRSKAQSGLVFTTESGTAVDPRSALRAISTAAKALGMSGVGLHTLRHSFATFGGRRATAYRLGATRALLRRGHRGRVRPRLQPRARALRSGGSEQQWAGENVCRGYTNGYTAAKRPPRILSETASDLLFPVGMTGFEPAAP